MKTLILAAIMMLTAVLQKQPTVNPDLKKLNWLTGTWKRTNTKPGQSGSETWAMASATKMTGKGVTLRGTDTAFVEKLSIVVKDSALYYVADVTGNTGAVYFKFTELTADSFVCENPEHDFPKKIAYKLTDGHIKATISGNGKSVDYLFDKVK